MPVMQQKKGHKKNYKIAVGAFEKQKSQVMNYFNYF